MKRVALYVRVSTQEQKMHGISIDSQLDALQKYSTEHGYTVAGIYNDAGISGRKKYTRRPALLQMIEDCKAGKIDLILFTKLDRWFRSVSDYYSVQGILEQCNIPWRAIWEDYETETSSGIFKVNIMLSIAQAESDRTGERIRSAFEYKRAQGEYVGTLPVGFMFQDKRIVKNPEQEDAINAMFRTYLDTSNVSAAYRTLRNHGVDVSMATARNALLNPKFAGILPDGGKCEAYITEEQHNEILEKFASYTRTPSEPKTYLFSGLVFCGYCGRRLVARTSTERRKRVKPYVYANYGCIGYDIKHKQVTIVEKKLERALLENIDDIFAEYSDMVTKSNMRSVHKDTLKELKNLEARLSRLKILFTDGDLTIDEYRKQRDRTTEKIKEIKKAEQFIDEPTPLPENWKEMYQTMSKESKRKLWARTIKRIEITNETKNRPFIIFH